jgi:RHS repeat-associated protein
MGYDGSGNVLRSYVHGPGTDEPLAWYEASAGWAVRYLHANHQGSIVALADASGNPVAISYDEYGIPGAGNQGRFQYTGQAWIPELGLYYYKARFYSPTLGRFLQSDPIGYVGSINVYAYVGNDPINLSDPEGEAPTRGGPVTWVAQNSRYSNPLTNASAVRWQARLQRRDSNFRALASISNPGRRYRSDAEAYCLSGAYGAREQAGYFGYSPVGSTMQAGGFQRVLADSSPGGLNNPAQRVSGSGTYQFHQNGSVTAALQSIVGSNYQARGGTLLAQNVPFGNGITATINVH